LDGAKRLMQNGISTNNNDDIESAIVIIHTCLQNQPSQKDMKIAMKTIEKCFGSLCQWLQVNNPIIEIATMDYVTLLRHFKDYNRAVKVLCQYSLKANLTNEPKLLLSLASLLGDQKSYQKALRVAYAAIEICLGSSDHIPILHTAYYNLGCLQETNKDFERSIQSFRSAFDYSLAWAPDLSEYLNMTWSTAVDSHNIRLSKGCGGRRRNKIADALINYQVKQKLRSKPKRVVPKPRCEPGINTHILLKNILEHQKCGRKSKREISEGSSIESVDSVTSIDSAESLSTYSIKSEVSMAVRSIESADSVPVQAIETPQTTLEDVIGCPQFERVPEIIVNVEPKRKALWLVQKNTGIKTWFHNSYAVVEQIGGEILRCKYIKDGEKFQDIYSKKHILAAFKQHAMTTKQNVLFSHIGEWMLKQCMARRFK